MSIKMISEKQKEQGIMISQEWVMQSEYLAPSAKLVYCVLLTNSIVKEGVKYCTMSESAICLNAGLTDIRTARRALCQLMANEIVIKTGERNTYCIDDSSDIEEIDFGLYLDQEKPSESTNFDTHVLGKIRSDSDFKTALAKRGHISLAELKEVLMQTRGLACNTYVFRIYDILEESNKKNGYSDDYQVEIEKD